MCRVIWEGEAFTAVGLLSNTAVVWFLHREAYKRLLSRLAEAGQNEIQKLEAETG